VSLAATLTLAIWVVGLTIGFNLVLAHRLDSEANEVLAERAQTLASALVVSPAGTVSVHERRSDSAIDRDTWVFQGRRLIEGPAIKTSLGGQAKALADRGARSGETDSPRPVRLYARPVLSHGRQVGTVVSSVDLSPYARTRDVALLGSLLLAVSLLVGVFLVVRLAVSRALSPVQAMTRQAAAWSVADTVGRFGQEVRPTELAALARTLDGLLARLAAVLRHEQQLAAELSHELRTPLSRIIAETDLLRERPQSAEELATGHASILHDAEEMREILETLLATARTNTGAPTGSCDAAEVARSLTSRLVPATSVKTVVVTQGPGDTIAGVDAAVLERALAPVLDNALRYAAREVRIEVGGGAGVLRIDVVDDGPGIEKSSLPHVFEPGRRGDPGDGHPGAGLGLALARRLLVASGGGISASSSARGAVFHLTLPIG
jgi:signal transduction histidine kinase